MEKFIAETIFVPVEHDPFAGPEIEQAVPTTEAQREVIAASEMGPEASCAYNESVTLELKGALDREALWSAMQELVRRHGALRSTIAPGHERMIILKELELVPLETDLSRLQEQERSKALADHAVKDMTTAFDLVNGPLFRARLFRIGDGLHQLRLTAHHAICDGWSLGIMMAEISSLYNSFEQRVDHTLPDPVPYADYALAMLDFKKSEEHDTVEQYWMDQFKGHLPHLDLPTDRPRPVFKTYNGARLDLELPSELVKALKETATRSGASFVTTLLTSFELLLYKLTGDSDIVVGLPAAGQSDLDMKHLVGHCVNLLALRSSIREERSFIEHLKDRRTAVLDAFDNQRYTFGTLLNKLRIPREPGRIPLVPVVFNIDMNMDDGVAFAGLEHRFISNPRAYENFELFLNATGSDERLTLEWSYNTDLFDAATIRSWMDALMRLVQRIAAMPSASMGELIAEDVTEGAPEFPPRTWIGNPGAPSVQSMTDRFQEMVRSYGSSDALAFGEARLSYAQLDERSDQLAGHLQAAGVGPGDPVGICMERGPDLIASMIATLKCGACFVPFDPGYPADRLSFMFNDTAVKVLLTEKKLLRSLPAHQANDLVVSELGPAPVPLDPPSIGPGSAAYIMYTSGSTGTPKGVVVPHRAVLRLVQDQEYLPFGPELTFLQLSNVSFDASTLEIWGALLNGGKLVLQPQPKPTLFEIVETIRQYQVTTVWFTVGLFNLLVDEHLERLTGLKHILTGGDVLSVPHVKKALRLLGPGVLINGYGPTENTTFTCCYAIDDASAIQGSVPIGRPISGTTVHVLDERMKPVPIGRIGELYTGGQGVALGYWKREELNAERFIPDPFAGGNGGSMYKTGDLVRWTPKGNIEFIGRADGQVKIRGFRIELGEIENTVDDVPEVRDRVVVARPTGTGEKQLVCYVVPKASGATRNKALEQELISKVREHLRDKLPEHMIPGAFVLMEALPLNPNGKVDKKALPAPSPQEFVMRTEHVSPRNDTEERLAKIWDRLLGTERIGIHDNFFELGGHSLIGIQMLSEVSREFGVTLTLKELFQASNIASFAQLIRKDPGPSRLSNLSVVQPAGDRPPFFCVHGDEANYFLPKYLGTAQPFFAFTHQGEDGGPIRFNSVSSIAEHFIRELRTVKPHGPYLLGGYSFGGIVAFEMARMLQEQGEQVPLLCLIDTYAPKEYRSVMQQEARFYDPIKRLVLRSMVRYYLDRGKVLPPKLRHFHIIDTYDRAILDYDLVPYAGEIVVLKAEGSTGTDHMGWDNEMTTCQVRKVPGDHYTLIKEPHVQELAGQLDQAIAEAREKLATQAV
ncbi:MAG: amino acid adenylation domain-containing protein [Flavobacteriales bacterium]|nr:amino acid adenylation domain-containing protein [Flavobacteriales bacterium]